jgi:hypothetical protein
MGNDERKNSNAALKRGDGQTIRILELDSGISQSLTGEMGRI